MNREQDHMKCPHCGTTIRASALRDGEFLFSGATYTYQDVSFNGEQISCTTLKCANATCEKESLWLNYSDANGVPQQKQIVPKSSAKPWPDYIPAAIREDYEEACLILNDSPKASAALARRCLQGMLRDFHDISEHTLRDEIQTLKKKGTESEEIVAAMQAVRLAGNDASHPKQNRGEFEIFPIEGDEAKDLLGLMEILLEQWYVSRHKEQERLARLKKRADRRNQRRE